MPVLLLTTFLLLPYFGVPGTFRGTVVRGPESQAGWIYVAGANGSLRKVEVSRAEVTYDDDVPARMRQSRARKSLVLGAEIRVTGEPDNRGEWHASEIEIIHLSPKARRAVAEEVNH